VTKRLSFTTQREIRAFFAERGRRPKRSLGQNFLVDPNLLRTLAEAADLDARDVVLEVGVGTGSLTEVLAERAGRVVGVELDPVLYQAAREALAPLGNVVLLGGSVLADDGAVAPTVREAVSRALAEGPFERFKVVGDLPYGVATPVLQAVLEMAPPPASAAVTVQMEVGERLAARPGTKAYGYLSVLVQSRCRVEVLRRLPPQVYWPRPKVWSALVRLTWTATDGPSPEETAALRRTAGALFGLRRKTAANALTHAGVAADRREAEALLGRAGIESDRRADALSVAEIGELARIVRHQRRPTE